MKREPVGVVVPMGDGTYLRIGKQHALYFYGARALMFVPAGLVFRDIEHKNHPVRTPVMVQIRSLLKNTHFIKGIITWKGRRIKGKVSVNDGAVYFEPFRREDLV